MEGLGEHAGPLLFQFAPLPRPLTTGEAGHATIERLGAFYPRCAQRRCVHAAVRSRTAQPRAADSAFIRMLHESGARLTIGVHANMPAAGTPERGACARSTRCPKKAMNGG